MSIAHDQLVGAVAQRSELEAALFRLMSNPSWGRAEWLEFARLAKALEESEAAILDCISALPCGLAGSEHSAAEARTKATVPAEPGSVTRVDIAIRDSHMSRGA